MNLTREALENFYTLAETSYKKLSEDRDAEIIVHYSGDLSYGFANALTSRLERILEERIERKKAKKRFFGVFVEAIQNIRLHSEVDKNEHVHSMVTVFLKNEKLCARFSNIIEKEEAENLASRYEEVNRMTADSLKKQYMETMMNGAMSDKGGAGLGILTIVMRSKNPSPVTLTPLNEKYDIFSHTIAVDLD
jgi:hypothetical protein